MQRDLVTVERFYTDHASGLELNLLAGAGGLKRIIREPTVNRPGLVLTGFTRYFAYKRVQTVGHAEAFYLKSLSKAQRAGRYKTFFDFKIMERIKKLVLDDSFSTALSGSSRDFAESSSNTSFAFILALILIFLILAAQFESFIDPIIIITTVPLALAGALLSLYLFGQTLNIFSQIGMIMLIGLVTKNGILIVEFANQNQLKGMKKTEAVIFAASQRLRPILMTSLAMSLGALPLALSLGDAATSRIPLGIVIVGGIMFSLILTLFVIPAMYSFMSTKKKKNALEEMDEAAAASV